MKKNDKKVKHANVYIICFILLIIIFHFSYGLYQNIIIRCTYKEKVATIIEISDIKSKKNPHIRGSKKYMDLTLRNDKDEVIFLNNMEIKFNEKKIKKGNEIAFLVKDDNYELVSNTTHTIVMNIATIVVMVVFMLHTLFIKKQNDIERKSKRNNTTYEQL